MPRRFKVVEHDNEQDARDIAVRRLTDEGFTVLGVDASEDVDSGRRVAWPDRESRLPRMWVVWMTVADS